MKGKIEAVRRVVADAKPAHFFELVSSLILGAVIIYAPADRWILVSTGAMIGGIVVIGTKVICLAFKRVVRKFA